MTINLPIGSAVPPAAAQAEPSGTCPCAIWDNATVPSEIDSGDPSAVELSVKFRSSSNGFITGLRFYKSPANTGPHVGNLWTSTGTLLASVIFSGETPSGWQQVNLPIGLPSTKSTDIRLHHQNRVEKIRGI